MSIYCAYIEQKICNSIYIYTYKQATLLKRTNQLILAERLARDAMNVDPTNFNVWRLLAEILSSHNSCEPASVSVITRALSTSIDLEHTEPIESFYSLPLGVYCT